MTEFQKNVLMGMMRRPTDNKNHLRLEGMNDWQMLDRQRGYGEALNNLEECLDKFEDGNLQGVRW